MVIRSEIFNYTFLLQKSVRLYSFTQRSIGHASFNDFH